MTVTIAAVLRIRPANLITSAQITARIPPRHASETETVPIRNMFVPIGQSVTTASATEGV